MWPWEHIAFGYVLYSAWRRGRHRSPPTDAGVVSLAVGTQLPDLVDKPLAWELHVLPGGRTLAHSLLVALPLTAVVVVVGYRRGRPTVGVAFAVGYLSHLLGDVISPLLLGGELDAGFLLWPLLGVEGSVTDSAAHLESLLTNYLAYAASPAGVGLVLLEALLLASALWLWLADGTPGVDRRWLGRPD